MTTLETVLISVLSTLGVIGLVLWGFWRWGLRKLAGVRSALGDVHAVSGYGRETPAAEAVGGYTTLEDEPPSVVRAGAEVKRSLPVVGRCEGCDAWSLAAGQRLLDAQPAFRAASHFISPSQMGQRRNPEYMAIERQIFEAEKLAKSGSAGAAAGAALEVSLREELARTPEYLNPEGIEKNMKVTWADFGICSTHYELRAKTDRCERFVPTRERVS